MSIFLQEMLLNGPSAAYKSSGFLALRAGSSATSQDGITWSTNTATGYGTPATTYSNALAWNGQLWVTTTNTGVWTSPDGLNWTQRAAAGVFGQASDMFYNGQYTLIISGGGVAQSGISYDGINWTFTAQGAANWGSVISGAQNQLAWNGSLWVMMDTAGHRSSPDGINWTLRNAVGTLRTDLKYAGGRFVSIGTGVVSVSTDGINWTNYTNTFGSVSAVNALVWNGSVWVLTTTTGGLYSSPDGITWTQRSAAFTGAVDMSYNGSYILAVKPNSVAISPDGINWTITATTFGQPNTTAANSLMWNGTAWILSTQAGGSGLWRSTNGTTWTQTLVYSSPLELAYFA